MNYWVFKVSDGQKIYPDVPGKKYVYDNMHSKWVAKGDLFIYLDTTPRKGLGAYSFTGTGTIGKVVSKKLNFDESQRTKGVDTIHTAHIIDMLFFTEPLCVDTNKTGKINRAKLGIENFLSFGISISRINDHLYKKIIDLAEINNFVPEVLNTEDYEIKDSWSSTKIRGSTQTFTNNVKNRCDSKCVVCGTNAKGFHEAHHLSPWATDKSNRGNPANGIYLCKFCHRAMDLKQIALKPDGELIVKKSISDDVALFHFNKLKAKDRRKWLLGVEKRFLNLSVKWFKESD